MLNFLSKHKTALPDPADALPGRTTPMAVPERHFVLDAPLRGPFPEDTEQAIFGLGCFWGAERKFWEAPGVHTHHWLMCRRSTGPLVRRNRLVA